MPRKQNQAFSIKSFRIFQLDFAYLKFSMKTGLFVYGDDTTFIAQDLELLKRHCDMRSHRMKMPKNPLLLFWELLKTFLFVVWHIRKADFVYCWFCDYHAFFPMLLSKIFKKKGVIVIGGFDAARNVALQYGAHIKPWRSKIIKYIASKADVLLPVSQSVLSGIKTHFGQDTANKSLVVYNGLNVTRFKSASQASRSGLVTVYKVNDLKRLKIKGGDFLAEAARKLPEYDFTVIGPYGKAAVYFDSFKLDNLRVLPPTSADEIAAILRTKKLYFQFSRIESFGIALVEGILSGCIPIGYNIEATSEIIQHPKLLFDQLSVAELKRALDKLSDIPSGEIEAIRQRCADLYDLKNREGQLVKLMDRL